MIERISDAARLLNQNFLLFSAIILTVCVPNSILVNYVVYNVDSETNPAYIIVAVLIGFISTPISSGALVYSLFRIKSGSTPTYSEALGIALLKWRPLFITRLASGFLVLLGLIALIIPGIMLMIRYSFIDETVVIEGTGVTQSLERSTELTSGRRWEIFGSILLFSFPFMVLSVLLSAPLESADPMIATFLSIIVDSVVGVFFSILQIVMFLFYWEATHPSRVVEEKMAM